MFAQRKPRRTRLNEKRPALQIPFFQLVKEMRAMFCKRKNIREIRFRFMEKVGGSLWKQIKSILHLKTARYRPIFSFARITCVLFVRIYYTYIYK